MGAALSSALTTRRKILLALLAYAAYKVYPRLAALRRTTAMLWAMPGPKRGEHEHWLLSHAGGDLIIPPGEKLDLHTITKSAVAAFERVVVTYDRPSAVRLMTLPGWLPINPVAMVIIGSADGARSLLSRKEQVKYKKGFSYEIAKPLIGESILKLGWNDTWRLHRRVLEAGMTHDVMRVGLPKVLECVDVLVDKLTTLNGKTSINLSEEMLKLTMDVIGSVALSTRFNSVAAATTADAPLYTPFQVILSTLEKRTIALVGFLLADVPFLEENRRFNSAISTLNGIVSDALIEHIRGPSRASPDMLDVILSGSDLGLLADVDEACEKLTKKEVIDDLCTMLFAGHDTTAAAGAWAIYLLAKHPEHIDVIREEARALGITKDVDPSYDDLEKLERLNNVVWETLRLYPSAAFTRETLEDVIMPDGVVIPAGIECFVVPYVLHRDPNNFESPNEFLPTRWRDRYLDVGRSGSIGRSDSMGDEDAHARVNSLQSRLGRASRDCVYLPFSLGARNCVGRPLALMELRCAVLKLVLNFDFQLDLTEEFQESPWMTLTLNTPPMHVKAIPL